MPSGWCCCLDSKDREHGDDHISEIVAGMADRRVQVHKTLW
jgi:hypothetical protein